MEIAPILSFYYEESLVSWKIWIQNYLGFIVSDLI